MCYNVFCQASVFNQAVDSWDISVVKTMYFIFHSTSAFNQHVGAWANNTPSNVNVGGMFKYSGCPTITDPSQTNGPCCKNF